MNELIQSLKENLSFVLICALIALALIGAAWLAERFWLKTARRPGSARYLATTGMCAALAGVLMLLELPVFFAPGFYKLDLSELPVLFCGFYLGPVSGVICELLKVTVKLLLKGTTTAFVGDFANFAVGCALVLPATVLYHIKKSRKSAIIGLAVGTAVMTVFGSLFNAVYLLPKFAELYGLPLDEIVNMGSQVNGAISSVTTLVLFAVVPLNLIKGAVVSLLTLLLYKRVGNVIFRSRP